MSSRMHAEQPACLVRWWPSRTDKYWKTAADTGRGPTRPARGRETTTPYELPGGAGEVVGERARFAGEVRRALVVPLVEGCARLIQEVLGGPQRFLLRRLERAALELAHSLAHIADALARALQKSLLLGRGHFWSQRARRGGGRRPRHGRRRRRGGRGGRGRGGRRHRRLSDRGLGRAARQEQQGRGGKQETARHIATRPCATGSVRIITVPRSTSDSTSTRPSCICTVRYTIESPIPEP